MDLPALLSATFLSQSMDEEDFACRFGWGYASVVYRKPELRET
jgi:hypothetical protein